MADHMVAEAGRFAPECAKGSVWWQVASACGCKSRILAIAALALHHLDFITVGILYKEKPDGKPAVAVQFLDRSWLEAKVRKLLKRVFEIIDGDGQMPIAGPMEYTARRAHGSQ